MINVSVNGNTARIKRIKTNKEFAYIMTSHELKLEQISYPYDWQRMESCLD
jgi:hypothetical protein